MARSRSPQAEVKENSSRSPQAEVKDSFNGRRPGPMHAAPARAPVAGGSSGDRRQATGDSACTGLSPVTAVVASGESAVQVLTPDA